MILFPYKKLVIETEMSEEEFFSNLNEETDKKTFFDWGCSDNYFLGEISGNSFNLIIAQEDKKTTEYKSVLTSKIKGKFHSGRIELKIGYTILHYLLLTTPMWVVFSILTVNSYEEIVFGFNFKSIMITALFVIFPYLEFRSYNDFKKNCKEIERKFLEISEGKIISK